MSTEGNYDAVIADIQAIIPETDISQDGNGPLFVRLAWHASGTFDKISKTGGSNGATMRFCPESTDGANAGLDLARKRLEPIKEKHPWISYADLWTLAGAVAIEATGGPKIPWQPGRVDVTDAEVQADSTKVPPNGRLPDADKGEDHIRGVFGRMGFTDREIVALIGAHSLGRCHVDRSGYEGPWTHTPSKFTERFFTHLLKQEWIEREVEGSGQKQFNDKTGKIMMLPADMAFRTDPEFNKICTEFAADKNLFRTEFAAAFGKLLELGVPRGEAEARL